MSEIGKRMTKAEEQRREKAKKMRYKRPIMQEMNLYTIVENLEQISNDAYDLRWTEDSEALIAALDGDEDEAFQFRLEFSDVEAEAERMLLLEHGPEGFDLRISALSIGDAALCGIPGEPFSETGRRLKALPGWKMALPCCCVNGYANYFPLASDYAEGGYEERSSLFQAGVAEQIEAECARLLDTLKKEETDK